MKNTKIVDNHPVCPSCGEASDKKLKVLEADSVTVKNEKYFEVKIKCRECSEVSYYFLDLEMNDRVSIDKYTESTYKKIVEQD